VTLPAMSTPRTGPQPGRPRWPWALATVRGESMLPTLHPGDRLLVRVTPRLLVDDLAVVRLPPEGTVAVKRVVHREAGGWWVERDNPRTGADSWSVGAVPDDAVIGRVVTRLWPLRRRRPARHLRG
jgi:nickel-type superoxide dismutase maturation protease